MNYNLDLKQKKQHQKIHTKIKVFSYVKNIIIKQKRVLQQRLFQVYIHKIQIDMMNIIQYVLQIKFSLQIKKFFILIHLLVYIIVNQQSTLKRENKQKISGEQLNFLAKGHKINHASEDKCPNVMLYDIKIDTSIFPSSFFNYSPCLSITNDNTQSQYGYILGVISIRDIEDNEELFLDYYDIYELDKQNQKSWLTVPQSQIDIYYTKKVIEFLNPTLIKYIKKKVFPQEKVQQFDINYQVNKYIEEINNKQNSDLKQLKNKLKQIEDNKIINQNNNFYSIKTLFQIIIDD